MGLFLILPFLGSLLSLGNKTYAILAGTVLQFTGYVKVAVADMPILPIELPKAELSPLAMSIKAARYLGLLVAIPLFSSLAKKKLNFSWV